VPRAIVCLPTYNERENLEPMLRALGDKGVRVLVVDDNSPDGTGELADGFASELDYVDVLHRERKEGLGPAYLAGFRRALADGAELILEMDCDFSHDPADVPRLIAAVEGGADLALGSRYVRGGSVGNWVARNIFTSATCPVASIATSSVSSIQPITVGGGVAGNDPLTRRAGTNLSEAACAEPGPSVSADTDGVRAASVASRRSSDTTIVAATAAMMLTMTMP